MESSNFNHNTDSPSESPLGNYWPLWLSQSIERRADQYAFTPVSTCASGRPDPVATLQADWRFSAMIENPAIVGQTLARITNCQLSYTKGTRPGVCRINFTRPEPRLQMISKEQIEACRAAGYPEVQLASGYTELVDASGILFAGRRGSNEPCPKPDETQIEYATRYFRETDCVAIKTPCVDSYGLKHTAERWAGDYISNGAAIVAASRLGIILGEYPFIERDRLNVRLAVSKRWYKSTYDLRSPEAKAKRHSFF